MTNYILNGNKDTIICLNSWIDKKDIVKMSEYFLEQKYVGGRVKVEVDFSNFAIKTDLEWNMNL